MSRIQPIDPTTATGTVATQLEGTRKAMGGTPNMFLTAAQSPAALTALNGFFGALATSSLGAKIGEHIAISVAQQNGCEYCLSAHTALTSPRPTSIFRASNLPSRPERRDSATPTGH